MKRVALATILAGFLIFLSSIVATKVHAQAACDLNCDNAEDKPSCLSSKIACWSDRVKDAQQSAITLKNTISVLNGQIKVLQLQIDQSQGEISKLEKEIDELSDRIEGLNYSLDKLTEVLVERVGEHYKRGYSNPISGIFAKERFSAILSEYKYLKLAKQQTATAMERAENQKITYDEQKALKEIKQQELEGKRQVLEGQRSELASKRAVEQNLLTETKNNEAVFQQKLSEARAEFEAIQAILAGKGDETKVGEVGAGERIASLIQGASCNSSGEHLHFIVSKNGVAQNPFGFLSGIDHVNCSGSSCGSGDGDPFNPSGSWSWPLPAKIEFYQGYGSTWAVRNTWVGNIYNSHNGIDVRSTSSSEVKAVREGVLYRGSFTGNKGCRLRYVRVEHASDDISTFYLHVNY